MVDVERVVDKIYRLAVTLPAIKPITMHIRPKKKACPCGISP